VTIAAAFRFETGILLCADTQYTSGAKIEETKMFTIKYHAATAVLVLTGRATYAKRAVEQITNSMKSLPEDELSKGNIQDAIESGLRKVFNDHVYPHPDWGKENSPDFSFVIGGYSPIDGDFLIGTEETISAEAVGRICLGSGAYLGEYLARMYLGRQQPLEQVVSLAIYILQQAKSYDSACGGKSEFVILWDDGDTSPVKEFNVNLGETYAESFTRCIAPLFYSMADVDKNDQEARKEMQSSIDMLVRNREMRRMSETKYNELIGVLRKKVEEEMPWIKDNRWPKR
jgi:20S proteasome alpha/beta subunit